MTKAVGLEDNVGVTDGPKVIDGQKEHLEHFSVSHLLTLQPRGHWSFVGFDVGLALGENVLTMVGAVEEVGAVVVGVAVGKPVGCVVGAAVVGVAEGKSVGCVVGAQKGHSLHCSFKHLNWLLSVAQSSSHGSLVGENETVGTDVGDSLMIRLSKTTGRSLA